MVVLQREDLNKPFRILTNENMLDLDLGISSEMQQVDDWMTDCITCGIETIADVGQYVFNSGGKRIRPAILLLSYKSLDGENISSVIPLAAALEVIHTGTIIHDDINDHSHLRRGLPTAHTKFGTTSALLTGDYLFVKAFEVVSDYDKEIRDIIIKSCVTLAEGEIIQSQSINNTSLSEEEYFEVIRKKTAAPISAGARAGGIIAGGAPPDTLMLKEYGLNLGIGFQITDDLLDVTGIDTQTGKFAGNDIREGKLTLLSIHALGNSDKSDKLKEVLLKPNKEDHEVAEALDIIKDADSIGYAKELGREYAEKAKGSIDDLQDSSWKDNLTNLADFAVVRNH